MLWGFYDVDLNEANNLFELRPIRGLAFQANVTRFLQPPLAPVNLLSIAIDPSSDFPSGHIILDATIQHPFVGFPRLRGFDVRGILMAEASMPNPSGEGELWPGLSETLLLNADGYTRWWNPTEFTTYGKIFGYTEGAKAIPGYHASGTINGYKYFADSLGPEAPIGELDLVSRGTFSADVGINTRRYEIQFAMKPTGAPDFRFNYAITASYAAPINEDDPTFPVESFPMEANMPEAFRLNVTDTASTAYFENESTYGGDLKFDLEVFDWGFATSSTAGDEVGGILMTSPTLFPGVLALDMTVAAPGSTPYSRTWLVEIYDVTPSAVENQEILISVLSSNVTTYAPDIPGITGFVYPPRSLRPMPDGKRKSRLWVRRKTSLRKSVWSRVPTLSSRRTR
jgi:hypothetical protein